uniref:Coiled-coil domain-containing protein 96 n=1 Tax=Lygus hesperus TaxID=30085 RepID=A0A0A9Z289_LYGHE
MSLEDVKIRTNETHGFTLVETVETDSKGNKRNVRKFYPRIRQKIKTYRKPVPIKVTFTKLINDVDLVEEEEDVNEEMEVDEIINTCLVKKKDKIGETILEEKEIVQEVIKYVGKKKKYMKLKMINDLGEAVDELIELNDDAKRTNDIMKSAAPYLKKKTKETPPPMEDKSDGQDSQHSMVGPEWYKAKDTQKDLIKLKAVEQLKQARDEQRALKDLNRYLGKKLCEYYDLKGAKDPNFSYDESGNNEEEKQKYQKRLLEFNDVINFIFNENKKRADMILKAERDTQRDAEELKKEKHNYYGLEEAMLKDVDPAEESKTLRSMTFAELLNHQKQMDSSLAKVRLECIRSEITLKDLEEKKEAHQNAIDNMEKVDFISFESLRFKTKDLNDKLDLKEKQVLAMKDRLTQRVQALAHVRLKSDHLTVENDKLRTETKDIVEELDALRKECLLVQIERRKLEKQLSKVKSKEGIQKYPYLIPEVDIVETKGEEQLELLGQLVNTCTELKSQMEEKLEDHRIGVEKYQRIQDDKKQKKKLFSFEFK